mmetsp:Transcript_39889/g.100201  ORF Transcript_39889/g.100201 Transcript_39889/m.100201 type:complete len:206 (-) Transcript_39889:1722-2339(-)
MAGSKVAAALMSSSRLTAPLWSVSVILKFAEVPSTKAWTLSAVRCGKPSKAESSSAIFFLVASVLTTAVRSSMVRSTGRVMKQTALSSLVFSSSGPDASSSSSSSPSPPSSSSSSLSFASIIVHFPGSPLALLRALVGSPTSKARLSASFTSAAASWSSLSSPSTSPKRCMLTRTKSKRGLLLMAFAKHSTSVIGVVSGYVLPLG